MSFVLAGCAAAIVVAAFVLSVFDRGESLLTTGSAAPDFTLRTIAGGTVSAQGLQGKPALLVFCASWPAACTSEVPALNRIARSDSVLFVNGDSEKPASVAAFARSQHAAFQLALDPGPVTVSFPTHGPRGPVTARYHVTTFPTYYVLDAEGKVAWRAAGAQPAAVLAGELRRAARSVP